jgi:hypothetical protein
MPRGKPKRAVPLERYTAMSQREVGRALGISSVRVSQIERSAFKKIRAAFEREGFEIREPVYRFSHNVLRFVSEREREEWLFKILLADCDLSEAPLARLWKAQV